MNLKTTFLFSMIAAATALNTGDAHAASQNACTVATVQYDNSQRIVLWCSGVASMHYAFGSSYGTSCGPVSLDTTKLWHSTLQSALLSGKKVDIDYTTNAGCFSGSVRIINAVRLQAN